MIKAVITSEKGIKFLIKTFSLIVDAIFLYATLIGEHG